MNQGFLTHSHNESYLRLLPKEGKDPNYLKNWRPITLSNCDLKLITKTFSIRMAKNLNCTIGHQQTAYLKSRQITDNLNIMQYVIEKSIESNKGSMIMSLDAEKAFDSIEHWYIKKVLNKLGLGGFNGIFDLLYSNQRVNILLNKQIAGSYNIKNGVKQGDALSCILFIMGIEPLIKNIENDATIPHLSLGDIRVPKILSYADDVACLIHPTQSNLDAIFMHYEKMTNVSGLKLNAEKTEIIELLGNGTYDVSYLGSRSQVSTSHVIKINGLQLSFDTTISTKLNMDKLFNSLESQLKQWSKRYLSILGKIQIVKTFGLSQILYIASTIVIPQQMEKKITELIYRFIWNNDINSKKAPDRIKRSILTNKVKDLGFGMIDYREVIRSIRLKMLLRLSTNKSHPMHDIIMRNINTSVINVENINKITVCIDHTIREVKKDWKYLLTKPPETQIPLLKNIILNEYVGNLLIPRFRSSRLGRLYRHDRLNDISGLTPNHPLIKKLDKKVGNFLTNTWDIPITLNNINSFTYLPTKNKILLAAQATSQAIRLHNSNESKVIPKLTRGTSVDGLAKLGNRIARITNCKLQTILLRALHGDIYSRSRMLKFGMVESDCCDRCGQTETIEHMLLECTQVKELWCLLSKLTSIPTIDLNTVLGYHDYHDKTTLTIHSEIIRRLLAIERPTIDKYKLLKSVISRLGIVEQGISKLVITDMLKTLEQLTQSDTSTMVLSLAASSPSVPEPVSDPESMSQFVSSGLG